MQFAVSSFAHGQINAHGGWWLEDGGRTYWYGGPQGAYWAIKALADFCNENAEELAAAEPEFLSEHETRRGRFIFHNDYVRRKNPRGECWIGVEKDGKVERIIDGQKLLANASSRLGGDNAATITMRISDLKLLKTAGIPPPVATGIAGVAIMPDESAWDAAAEYEIPSEPGDKMLEIHYFGDMARLYADGRLVQDDFWKVAPIRYALRRLPKGTKHLVLKVLPRGALWEEKIYIDIIPSLHYHGARAYWPPKQEKTTS